MFGGLRQRGEARVMRKTWPSRAVRLHRSRDGTRLRLKLRQGLARHSPRRSLHRIATAGGGQSSMSADWAQLEGRIGQRQSFPLLRLLGSSERSAVFLSRSASDCALQRRVEAGSCNCGPGGAAPAALAVCLRHSIIRICFACSRRASVRSAGNAISIRQWNTPNRISRSCWSIVRSRRMKSARCSGRRCMRWSSCTARSVFMVD